MSGTKFGAIAIAFMFFATKPALAQFFIGSPTGSYATTSGTVTGTPTVTANNILQEIDFVGQFDVSNAAPTIQTSSINFSCQLDPTFNGGTPLLMQLQVTQSGFTNVPAGGQIYGWTIGAGVIDNTGQVMGGGFLNTTDPSGPYSPGTTTFGPTTAIGSTFLYTPATASELVFDFGSNFDGLVGPNTYTWDFPLSVRLVEVPEPTAISAMGLCLMALSARKR